MFSLVGEPHSRSPGLLLPDQDGCQDCYADGFLQGRTKVVEREEAVLQYSPERAAIFGERQPVVALVTSRAVPTVVFRPVTQYARHKEMKVVPWSSPYNL